MWNIEGISRHVPPDWVSSVGPFMNVYLHWRHGDKNLQISSPMKLFT